MMKIFRSLVFFTALGLFALGFSPQLPAGALNTGKGGVNAGLHEAAGLRSTFPQRTSSDGKTQNTDQQQMGSNVALQNAANAGMGSNVGLTTGTQGNMGLGAQPQILLSAEPVRNHRTSKLSNIDEWKARNYGREPVRSYNTNAIDSEGNIFFSPNPNSSRLNRN